MIKRMSKPNSLDNKSLILWYAFMRSTRENLSLKNYAGYSNTIKNNVCINPLK